MLPVQRVTRAGVGVVCDNVLKLGADLQVKQMRPVTRLWIHVCDSGSGKYSCGFVIQYLTGSTAQTSLKLGERMVLETVSPARCPYF